MKTYRRYLKYLFAYKLSLFFGITTSLLTAAATVAPIFIIQNVVKAAFEEKNYNKLIFAIIIGLIAIFVIFVLTYLSRFIMEYLSRRVIYQVRNSLFSSLMFLPLKFYKDEKAGNIISTATNDIQELQFFTASSVLSIIKEPLVIILVLIKMFDLNYQLTALIFLISPLFVWIIHILSRKVKNIETRIRQKLANLTSYIHQAIYGIEIVKVFAMEKKEIDRFNAENTEYLKEDKKNIQYINLAKPLVDFVGGLGVLFLLGVGGYMVIKNIITTSELTALVVALTTLSLPIKNFSETFIHIKRTSVSLDRIFKLMDNQPETDIESGTLPADNVKGEVTFTNVSFDYGSGKVLDELNFTVNAGQVAALVGHSGAGKTTLVNLLPRLISPTGGKILLDGIDSGEYRLSALRNRISMVTQNNIIFSASIKENIAYGKPAAGMDEIIEAARISNCLEFIEKMPEGFDTYVGDRGLKLSGGQCQRITLARAILKKPAILILDEATSSLDGESEKLIQDALSRIIRNQTTFVIAHRLSTIYNADIIFVLENGKIIEKGTHNELLTKKGMYKRFYDLQFDL